MSFPLRQKVYHQRYLGVTDGAGNTVYDEHGNEVESWAPKLEVLVFGWEPPKSTEPVVAGHDRVIVDIQLYAPVSVDPLPHDLMWLVGKKFQVIGYPEDPNHNGFWAPGLVTVNLRRVEG